MATTCPDVDPATTCFRRAKRSAANGRGHTVRLSSGSTGPTFIRKHVRCSRGRHPRIVGNSSRPFPLVPSHIHSFLPARRSLNAASFAAEPRRRSVGLTASFHRPTFPAPRIPASSGARYPRVLRAPWPSQVMRLIPLVYPLVLLLTVATALAAPRTNFVLCMTDDQGWGDTGYNGNPVLRTPNLDAMAAAGVRFDRFYAAYPVCSPTRGSLLSGRNPSRCSTNRRVPFRTPRRFSRSPTNPGPRSRRNRSCRPSR